MRASPIRLIRLTNPLPKQVEDEVMHELEDDPESALMVKHYLALADIAEHGHSSSHTPNRRITPAREQRKVA